MTLISELSLSGISDEENDELLTKGKEIIRRGGISGDPQVVKSIKVVAKAAVEAGFELYRQEQIKVLSNFDINIGHVSEMKKY